MSYYDHDQGPYDYDDDERFYEETVYNEEYYLEREQELIRQSNLELELEELKLVLQPINGRSMRRNQASGFARTVIPITPSTQSIPSSSR